MAYAVGIIVLVVGLMLSIALHEIGHLVPAKRFGVRVSQYMVGFGPTLFSRTRGETEYGVKAFPLGGFVRLVGMIPPAHAVKPVRASGWVRDVIADAREASVAEMVGGDEERAFYRLAWWKKAIVMFGGPAMNLLIAVVLFSIAFAGIGAYEQSTTVREVIACVPAAGTVECADGDESSPAAQAGLQPGDEFVAVDGTAVESWEQLTAYVSARPGESLTLTVRRDGQMLDVPLTPAVREREAADGTVEAVGFMGLFAEAERVRQPWWSGVTVTGTYLAETAKVIGALPVHVWNASQAALGLQERDPSVVGLVGIGQTAGEVASQPDASFLDRIGAFVVLLAGLNLALFAFNMVPLVPLDGGHIASALWQGARNGWLRLRHAAAPRPVDVARMMPLAYGVFGILIVMTLVLVFADIVAPARVV